MCGMGCVGCVGVSSGGVLLISIAFSSTTPHVELLRGPARQ